MKHHSCIRIYILLLALLAGLFLCAAASAETHSGSCGANATWTLDDAGKLTISGSGEMTSNPWISYKNTIKSVIIENGITSISDYSFRNCSTLTGITIPSSVKTIGSGVFQECSSLPSIIVPTTVTKFGDALFRRCTALKTVSFQAPIDSTRLLPALFLDCPNLTSINIPSNHQTYSSKDGIVFDKAGKALICYPAGKKGSYSISSSVTKIGSSAFVGCPYLTSITIPNSVQEIGLGAFVGCNSLTSITIPGNVNIIRDGAFYQCNGLTSVTVSEGVKEIPNDCFTGCSSLKTIKLPHSLESSVTRIGDTAFECCRLLSSVSFPSSVKSIGTSAFSECESLSSLTIPKTITSFGNAVFNKCTGIKTITFDGGIKNINFYSIFINCFGITAVNVPSGNTIYASQNGIVFDKAMTTLLFYPRGKNGSYSIPAGITKVADSAFKQSRNLTSVKIPNSVKEIGLDAFRYCTNLKSVSIPGSISEIKENTFHDCNLTNLVIPEGVKRIGNRAFYGNMEMKKLSLPHSLESIGEEAFYWTFLTDVNLHSNIRSIGDFAFDRTTPIYAPEDSYAAQWAQQNCYNYKKAEPEYAVTLQYTKDQGSASATPAYGTAGTKVSLKASPKKGFLFSGWTVVSGGVKIENNQFKIGTSDVVIKAEFKKDPSYASVKGAEYKLNKKKKTATYLNPTSKTKTSITIPATINVDGVKYHVTEIAANAFKGCAKLKKVTIGKNITKIGKNAFKGCKKLTSIIIKTTKLTKKGIGSSCFKDIASKPTFKCPKKQKDDYKTWILKTGKAPKKSKFK